MYVDPHSAAEAGESDKVQYAYAREIAQPQPFTLQAPPIKVTGATPRMEQDGWHRIATTTIPRIPRKEERSRRCRTR
jgi:hypothetical protein